MASYLNAYADQFDLRQSIRFRSNVTAIGTVCDCWTVRLGDGTEYRFEAVVVASGHQSKPHHPSFAE